MSCKALIVFLWRYGGHVEDMLKFDREYIQAYPLSPSLRSSLLGIKMPFICYQIS